MAGILKSFTIRNYPLTTQLVIILTGVIVFLAIVIKVTVLHNNFFTSPSHTAVASEEVSQAYPTFLRVPRLSLAVVIDQAKKDEGFGPSTYQYLLSEDKKQIILYGDRSKDVFGKLAEIKKGDEVRLVTRDGMLHTYKVSDIFVASLSELTTYNEEALFLITKTLHPQQKSVVIKALPSQ